MPSTQRVNHFSPLFLGASGVLVALSAWGACTTSVLRLISLFCHKSMSHCLMIMSYKHKLIHFITQVFKDKRMYSVVLHWSLYLRVTQQRARQRWGRGCSWLAGTDTTLATALCRRKGRSHTTLWLLLCFACFLICSTFQSQEYYLLFSGERVKVRGL